MIYSMTGFGSARAEAPNLSVLVDARCLDHSNFMLTETLSDDIETTCKRGVAERSIGLARKWGSDGGGQRFFRVT